MDNQQANPANPISEQDFDLLSAYLDGELGAQETAELESRLAQEPALQSEWRALQAMVRVLGEMPDLQAPRDFTLTPEQANQARQAESNKIVRPRFASLWQTAAVVAIVFAGAFLLLNRAITPETVAPPQVASAPTAIPTELPAVMPTALPNTAPQSATLADAPQDAAESDAVAGVIAGGSAGDMGDDDVVDATSADALTTDEEDFALGMSPQVFTDEGASADFDALPDTAEDMAEDTNDTANDVAVDEVAEDMADEAIEEITEAESVMPLETNAVGAPPSDENTTGTGASRMAEPNAPTMAQSAPPMTLTETLSAMGRFVFWLFVALLSL
jgi:negative regulator of sigma E activity